MPAPVELPRGHPSVQVCQDLYGNGNTVSNVITFLHDPDAPTVALTTGTPRGPPVNQLTPFYLTVRNNTSIGRTATLSSDRGNVARKVSCG